MFQSSSQNQPVEEEWISQKGQEQEMPGHMEDHRKNRREETLQGHCPHYAGNSTGHLTPLPMLWKPLDRVSINDTLNSYKLGYSINTDTTGKVDLPLSSDPTICIFQISGSVPRNLWSQRKQCTEQAYFLINNRTDGFKFRANLLKKYQQIKEKHNGHIV